GKPVYLIFFVRLEPSEQTVKSIWGDALPTVKHHYTAVTFSRDESLRYEPLWALNLSELYPVALELNDAHLSADGILFLNANYSSYAKEVRRKTAYLWAVDPDSAQALWRSDALRSRYEFAVLGDVIVAGYGFTSERDYLYLLDAQTGRTLKKARLKSGPSQIRLVGDDAHVATYGYDYVMRITTE
ncbi:MAG: hypothetical protein AAFQ82_21190, partial [Myxococcota bacterium]